MQMSRKLFVCLTLSLLALVVGVTTTQAQNFKWWKDDRFIKELALTPDQIARIDAVFQAPQPTLRAQKRALDKLEDELSAMIHDPKVEEAELEALHRPRRSREIGIEQIALDHDRAHEPRAHCRAEHQAASPVRENVTSSARNGRTTRSRKQK